jgi:spore maturation protein CgeB
LDHAVDVRVWGYGWDKFSQSYQSRNAGSARRLGQAVGEFLSYTAWQDGLRRLFNLELLRSAGKTVRQAPEVTLPDDIIGGVLTDSDMIEMYSRSKINLGFSTCGATHETEERIVQVRLRDFEVPMSGGFYLVEYMEELEEFFDIGKEIVCYADPQDLVEKIRYYLEHEDQREEIRKAGYERAVRNHTWHNRFQMAFKQMGMDA